MQAVYFYEQDIRKLALHCDEFPNNCGKDYVEKS